MADSAGEKNVASESKAEETQKSGEQAMEVVSSENEASKVPKPSAGGDTSTEQIDEVKTREAIDRETGTKSVSHADNSGNAAIPHTSQPEIKGDNAVQTEAVQKAMVGETKSNELTSNQSAVSAVVARQEQVMQVDEASQESTDTQDSNSENCYCGKGRNLGTVELQCAVCLRWYHNECINCYVGTCMPYMTNYQFGCKRCNATKVESFTRRTATFSQMCLTAVANLAHQHPNTVMFSKDKDIIPYIDKHWENLTSMPRRVKLTWHNTVLKTMTKESEIFVSKEEANGDYSFSLLNPDLTRIGPGLEALKAVALASRNSDIKAPSYVDSKSSRSTKRRFPVDYQQLQGSRAKRSELGATTKMAPHGYPLEHPFNKDGYRYILAEPDPHAPNRQAFDESLDWAGKPIPGYLYRTFLGSEVLLALHDRAPQLKIGDDRLTVTGDKGYSMIRATHGVRCGAWYFEVIIDDMPAETGTRIGWSQPLGNLQAPCGYDKFSYSWRSKKGTRFHQSRGKHYTEDGYSTGDVLGFYIYLPDPDDPGRLLPPNYKDKPLVKFKSHLYYEEKDYVSETEKNLKPAPGSKIVTFRNGQAQPVAFEDIFEGVYYPAVSLYKNASVTINFGPVFKHPPEMPKDLQSYKPMSEAASQAIIEHCLSDVIYHVENEGKQPEF
ncbi:set1/Ash2 histone methyltransferase complex subunit ASH2-like [Liolophura sinensis]|uniref:set1/Ash2 histone methyltransferase complex subunit ASH2-like n=1 Tax=Liolophura sinensis TaxID=3198878 RepID=UPI003158591B